MYAVISLIIVVLILVLYIVFNPTTESKSPHICPACVDKPCPECPECTDKPCPECPECTDKPCPECVDKPCPKCTIPNYDIVVPGAYYNNNVLSTEENVDLGKCVSSCNANDGCDFANHKFNTCSIYEGDAMGVDYSDPGAKTYIRTINLHPDTESFTPGDPDIEQQVKNDLVKLYEPTTAFMTRELKRQIKDNLLYNDLTNAQSKLVGEYKAQNDEYWKYQTKHVGKAVTGMNLVATSFVYHQDGDNVTDATYNHANISYPNYANITGTYSTIHVEYNGMSSSNRPTWVYKYYSGIPKPENIVEGNPQDVVYIPPLRERTCTAFPYTCDDPYTFDNLNNASSYCGEDNVSKGGTKPWYRCLDSVTLGDFWTKNYPLTVPSKGTANFTNGGLRADYIFNGFNTRSPFTFECYYKPNVLDSYHTLFSMRSGTSEVFVLYLNKVATGSYFRINGSGDVQFTDTTAIGKWSHIALVYDGSSFKLFIDGKLVKTDTELLQSIPDNIEIGTNNGGYYLKSSLSYLHISNNAKYTTDFTPKPVGSPTSNTLALLFTNETTSPNQDASGKTTFSYTGAGAPTLSM